MGDDVAVAREYAHYDSWNDGKGTTKPVGSFKPNGYGLFDMSGTFGNGVRIDMVVIRSTVFCGVVLGTTV